MGRIDQHTLTGVLCLSRRLAFELPDAALLWGVQVLPRYRGTIVSRLLMESALQWSEQELRIHWVTSNVARNNIPARQYLERFGFERLAEVGDGIKEGEGSICMRRRI